MRESEDMRQLVQQNLLRRLDRVHVGTEEDRGLIGGMIAVHPDNGLRQHVV